MMYALSLNLMSEEITITKAITDKTNRQHKEEEKTKVSGKNASNSNNYSVDAPVRRRSYTETNLLYWYLKNSGTKLLQVLI